MGQTIGGQSFVQRQRLDTLVVSRSHLAKRRYKNPQMEPSK